MSTPSVCEIEKDALSEAGNIAAANAVSSLSKLIGQRVNLDITECQLKKTDEIPYLFGDGNQQIVAVNMLIPTRNLCSVLMLFPVQSAMEYCDLFVKNEVGTTKEISYSEIVILTEIGNICICAYLNALAKLLDMKYLPTPPAVACDIVGSILEDVAVSADVVENNAILLKTNFGYDSCKFKGQFLFIPDRDSAKAIFKAFNI